MAATSGTQDLDLTRSVLGRALREHPGRFDFFQAVRLMERLSPDRAPVGLYTQPEREVVRFGVHNTLAFPISQIYALDWPEEGQPRMIVNFFGLTGPAGVLPYAYTELIRERLRAKDRTLQDFFDLFNHRMLSLFYQAWEKYRFFVAYERDGKDRFSRFLMSFVGLGTAGLQARQAVADQALLYYSGLLSLQPRSAEALEQLLTDYFGVPAKVEQFVGAWYPLSEPDLTCIEDANTEPEQLGVGVVAGDEIWDQQSRAQVVLGPLTLAQYLSFLPIGTAAEPLKSLVRFFAGDALQFEVKLVLKREEVPRPSLGVPGAAEPMLGWTTWMKSGPAFGRDPGDAVFLLN
jgi:type VI secretion system protein ImpH